MRVARCRREMEALLASFRADFADDGAAGEGDCVDAQVDALAVAVQPSCPEPGPEGLVAFADHLPDDVGRAPGSFVFLGHWYAPSFRFQPGTTPGLMGAEGTGTKGRGIKRPAKRAEGRSCTRAKPAEASRVDAAAGLGQDPIHQGQAGLRGPPDDDETAMTGQGPWPATRAGPGGRSGLGRSADGDPTDIPIRPRAEGACGPCQGSGTRE